MQDFIIFLLYLCILLIVIIVISSLFEKKAPLIFNVIKGGSAYDEYDDKNLLYDKDEDFIKSVDNIIIDANNFIYKLNDYMGGTNLDTNKYFELLNMLIEKLNIELPNKNIFIVLKDPENDKQLLNVKQFLEVDNIEKGYKKYFTKILKQYKKTRILMTFGEVKSRDDFGILWLSDQLGQNTIILSRDRYSDYIETNQDNNKIKFIMYGSNAAKYNKILNKPFTHITKASRSNLVGYSFSKKYNTAFYNKKKNKKSIASEYVLIINMK